MEFQKAKKINEWKEHPERFTSENGYTFIRNYLLEKYGNKCEKCGWGKENQYTHSVPLEVHHINGDCTNNREENLQLLCPNCHSLTENFGSRNKGSRRYKLMEYKRRLRE
jgi:predicted HNH restriction endonuclease